MRARRWRGDGEVGPWGESSRRRSRMRTQCARSAASLQPLSRVRAQRDTSAGPTTSSIAYRIGIASPSALIFSRVVNFLLSSLKCAYAIYLLLMRRCTVAARVAARVTGRTCHVCWGLGTHTQTVSDRCVSPRRGHSCGTHSTPVSTGSFLCCLRVSYTLRTGLSYPV